MDDTRQKEFKEVFQISRDKLLAILGAVELLTQINVSGKSFPLSPVSVNVVLNSAVESATAFAKSREVLIGQVPDCDGQVLCDLQLLTKALSALIETAVKFSTKGSTVSLSYKLMENDISIAILGNGRVIPEDAIPRFFEVFSIAEPITPGGDIVLGPPLAERIIKLFNGSVAVENHDSPGISLTVTLKRIKCEK